MMLQACTAMHVLPGLAGPDMGPDMVTSGRGADLPNVRWCRRWHRRKRIVDMWQRYLSGVSGLDSSNIGLGFCLFFFELLSRDVGDGCTPRRAVRLVCTCPHRDFSAVLGGVWLQPVATRLAFCCSTSWMALLGGHWTCVSCAEHILVNGGSRHLRPPLGGASTKDSNHEADRRNQVFTALERSHQVKSKTQVLLTVPPSSVQLCTVRCYLCTVQWDV